MGTYTILYSAVVSGTASTGSPGDVLIPDATSGLYVRATTANRGTRRATGIALTSYVAGGTVDIIQYGEVPTTITGFTAAAASWVRCSTAGSLEKVTPGAGDDIMGKVDTDGRLFLDPGKWDSTNYTSSGGATTPTGTGLPHIVGGVQNAAASLVVDADVTSVGIAKITGLGANVPTWLATPSGANLASALTSALPVSKGGTGATASTGSGNVVLATSPSLTTPTMTDPVITPTRINNAATGTINDCTLSGSAGFIRRVFFTNAGGATVNGFDATGIADGTLLFVTATGATGVSLVSENAGSAAANRITTNSNFTEIVTTGCFTILQYDLTNTRWRAIAGSAI